MRLITVLTFAWILLFAIAVRADKQVPACPGCTCGCQEGYECTCAKAPAKKAKKATRKFHYETRTQCSGGSCSQVRVKVYDDASPVAAPVAAPAPTSAWGVRGRFFGRFRR